MKRMIMAAVLGVAVIGWTSSVRAEGDGPLVPGGVELTALNDGTPAVGVDVAAAAKAPKGDNRNAIVRAWDATIQNIKANPKTWVSGAVAAGAVVASESSLFGGGSGKKSSGNTTTKTKTPRPAPAYVVGGYNNNVTAPATTTTSGNPVAVVGGHDNTLTLTDPPEYMVAKARLSPW